MFFITFAPFNPRSKNVHFVLIFGTFRFADYTLIYLATVGTESEVINSIYLLKNIPYEWLRDKLKEVIPEIVELIKSEDEEEKHYVYNKILSLYYFLGYKEELDDFINNICKGHQIELIRELYDDWKDWKK